MEIPKSGRRALARLLTADPKFLNALHDALANAKPSLFWSDSAISEISARLEGFPEATAESLESILRMLTGVLGWRDGKLPSEFAAELVDAAKASDDNGLKAKDDDWNRLSEFLARVFAIDRLSISAKASQLFGQTPRHMHTARVLTDARPIFTNPADGGPTGFVIIHTLQLEYAAPGSEDDREFFIGVDTGDLETLKDAVERALQKERSLRATLEKTDLPVITYPNS